MENITDYKTTKLKAEPVLKTEDWNQTTVSGGQKGYDPMPIRARQNWCRLLGSYSRLARVTNYFKGCELYFNSLGKIRHDSF